MTETEPTLRGDRAENPETQRANRWGRGGKHEKNLKMVSVPKSFVPLHLIKYTNIMRKLLSIVLCVCVCHILCAQEFRASVSVNTQKLETTAQGYETNDAKKFAETMKQSLESFMNDRRWTNLQFEQNERLDCSISLVLVKRTSATEFEGQLSLQLRRTVFNSNYTSGLFNFMGSNDFKFVYDENQPFNFDPLDASTFNGNLLPTLAYYAYIMLGIYFDSYGMMGGTSFYEMASTIAQTAAASPVEYRGWKSTQGQKARYWFAENHTNPSYEPLRLAYYQYNRLGLDMMTKDQKQARANIILALKSLQQVHKTRANVLSVNQFVDVKMQELISIFTPAPDDEKKEVYFVIKEVSPINVAKLKDWKIQ